MCDTKCVEDRLPEGIQLHNPVGFSVLQQLLDGRFLSSNNSVFIVLCSIVGMDKQR